MKNTKEFWIEIKEDLKIPIILLICIFFLTVIASIFFEKIPILIHLGIYKNENFWESFIINLHNSILDVLLFGIFFTFIAKRIAWKREIQQYEDIISENRNLNSQDVPHKISQCIIRLNNYGITEINLTKCNLSGSILEVINNKIIKLDNSKLMGSNLENVRMKKISLEGANLKGVTLKNSDLSSANLMNSQLRNIKCDNTNCKNTNFTNADLLRAKLENSNFQNANFKNTDLKEVSFKNSTFQDANFLGVINLNIEDLMEAKSLRKIKIESDKLEYIKNNKPNLLD